MAEKQNKFDRYATAKSGGQAMLTIGLLIDTSREIYDVTQAKEILTYFELLVSLLAVSLTLQLLGIILMLVLAVWTYPEITVKQVVTTLTSGERPVPEGGGQDCEDSEDPLCSKMRIVNDAVTGIACLIAVLQFAIKIIKGLTETSADTTTAPPSTC